MKMLLSLMVLVMSSAATADQFKTVTIEDSSKNYFSVLTIQQLLPTTVATAYDKINVDLLKSIRDYGCDAQDAADSENGYDYSVNARIIALNSSYVAYELTSDSYCGGAHPNYSTYYATYDSQTGVEVDMNAEVPMQGSEVSFEETEKFQGELAEVIYNSADFKNNTNQCFEGLSKKEALEELSYFYPYIAGLAKGKTVVLAVSVPHVATPCAFSVRVPVSKVKKFLAKDSVIFSLINY